MLNAKIFKIFDGDALKVCGKKSGYHKYSDLNVR